MPDSPWNTISTTNTTEKSSKELHLDCNVMWSMIQQMSTERLCVKKGRYSGSFVFSSSDRARRIAATYAQIYLETDKYGDTNKKGRFYWMALGAFASKTVACSLDDPRVNNPIVSTVHEGLAKGNMWLFFDISGWHWYYTRFGASFDVCVVQRDASKYVKPVRDQMAHYPWKDEALPKIRNMHEHEYIVQAFSLSKEIETSNDDLERTKLQLQHLLAIANHEQGVILQPLIYDDPCFSNWVQGQRLPVINMVSPELQLAFTSACDTKDAQLKSVAPRETQLEKFSSRMAWITEAAKLFHSLINNRLSYMEQELHAIAAWVEMDRSSDQPHISEIIP